MKHRSTKKNYICVLFDGIPFKVAAFFNKSSHWSNMLDHAIITHKWSFAIRRTSSFSEIRVEVLSDRKSKKK